MPQECLVKLNEVTEGDPLCIVHPIEGEFLSISDNNISEGTLSWR